MADLPLGANRKEQAASSCRLARLHRSLALDGFESHKIAEKKEETPKGVSSWQRMRDSNPRKRSQSPVCYRYTNPLCGRFASRHKQHGYYSTEKENVKHYFPFLTDFFPQEKDAPEKKKICIEN